MPLGKTYSNTKRQQKRVDYAKRMSEMLEKAEEYSEPLTKEEFIRLCECAKGEEIINGRIDIFTSVFSSVLAIFLKENPNLDILNVPLYMHVAIRQIYKLEEQQVADL